MVIACPRLIVPFALASATVLCLVMLAPASELIQQSTFSHDALTARVPIVREHWYVMNVRVRPLLLFWVARSDVGGARITWREASGGRRTFEVLAGSDPVRAPRKINRWGFIVEERSAETVEVFGVMRESSERTIEEAKAEVARQDAGSAMFKAIRTTITNGRAVSGTMSVQAPSTLTYRELDKLLALIALEPPHLRTVELPRGVQAGFLSAMDSLMHDSIGPCRGGSGDRARYVPAVAYIYGNTLFDLSLLSCDHKSELQTTQGTFADVVDGRFRIRNRTTKSDTNMRVAYGASGELTGAPVRAVFRPRWWMEVELVLDRSAGSGASSGGRSKARDGS